MQFVCELSDLEVLSFEDESLLAFLQDTKLIKTSLACPKCLSDCAIYKKKSDCAFFLPVKLASAKTCVRSGEELIANAPFQRLAEENITCNITSPNFFLIISANTTTYGLLQLFYKLQLHYIKVRS